MDKIFSYNCQAQPGSKSVLSLMISYQSNSKNRIWIFQAWTWIIYDLISMVKDKILKIISKDFSENQRLKHSISTQWLVKELT